MIREMPVIKDKDWSLNLEDFTFADQPEELIREAVRAVEMTAFGRYVNLVTPAATGHPEHGLLDRMKEALEAADIPFANIVYIDECGCGGFVTRVYR